MRNASICATYMDSYTILGTSFDNDYANDNWKQPHGNVLKYYKRYANLIAFLLTKIFCHSKLRTNLVIQSNVVKILHIKIL